MGEDINIIGRKARKETVRQDIRSLSIGKRIKAIQKREADIRKRVRQLMGTSASLDDLLSSVAYEFEMSKDEVRERLTDFI